MDRDEALELFKREGLEEYAHFGEPDEGDADKVCLIQRGNRWVTMITDEDAVVYQSTIRGFASEGEALEDMIDGLRVVRNAQELSD